MFAVAVVGEDWLVSAVLQAVLQVMASIEALNPLIRMVVIPTCEFLWCTPSSPLTASLCRCGGGGITAVAAGRGTQLISASGYRLGPHLCRSG